jgi:ankyrin repeat protein
VEARDATIWTPLAAAACQGHLECVKILLKCGASVDSEGNNTTPLHFAAERGHVSVVKYLISEGADVAAKDMEGYNALEAAVRKNQR